MKLEVVIILALLIVVGVAYFSTPHPRVMPIGGIPPTTTSSPFVPMGPNPVFGNGATAGQGNGAYVPGTNITSSSVPNPADIPTGFSAQSLSPFFHKLKITGASPSYLYEGSEVVTIAANFQTGELINTAGWYLKADRGSMNIPKAVLFYDPSGLAAEFDIVVKSGDVLRISSAISPVGKNFRINKCVGFLSETNSFSPPLPSCARSIVNTTNLKQTCIDYINQVPSCFTPILHSVPLSIQADSNCFTEVQKISFSGCYNAHRNDPDFVGSEVRIWTGSRFLSPKDRVLLYDKNGLLVDEYRY